MPVLKLKPAFKEYIWGGTRLITQFYKDFKGERLAESWELSCHPDGESRIEGGKYEGRTLSGWLRDCGDNALGRYGARSGQLPILIKLIDAAEQLSVQVHPDDRYAKRHEAQNGKTEAWYILDAPPDGFLYLGFRHKISKKELRKRIDEATLDEVLFRMPVQIGDVVYVEPGTVHAIGKGLLVAEIQQSSNVTYRVFDYGRRDENGLPRALHIDKALAVARLCPMRKVRGFGGHLVACPYFTADKVEVEGEKTLFADGDSFHSLIVLEGSGTALCGGERVACKKGDSLFIPAGSGYYHLSGKFEALLTTAGRYAAKRTKHSAHIHQGEVYGPYENI